MLSAINKNMSRKIKIAGVIFACSLGVLTSRPAAAQEKKQGWGETNKLEDAEIIVEKNRVNELPEANRNYEKFKIEPPEKSPGRWCTGLRIINWQI